MSPRQRGLRRLLTLIDGILIIGGVVSGHVALIVVGVANLAGLWANSASNFLDS